MGPGGWTTSARCHSRFPESVYGKEIIMSTLSIEDRMQYMSEASVRTKYTRAACSFKRWYGGKWFPGMGKAPRPKERWKP